MAIPWSLCKGLSLASETEQTSTNGHQSKQLNDTGAKSLETTYNTRTLGPLQHEVQLTQYTWAMVDNHKKMNNVTITMTTPCQQ